MFSGIIAYRGTIVSLVADRGGALLRVACEGVIEERPVAKDSVAIDGVCLTVARVNENTMTFDVVPETLARTTLGARHDGDAINIEYALRVGDRVGGHFVYGHVDTVAHVLALEDEGQGKRVRIERPKHLARAIVEKGFIAIDGVSLTIAATHEGWFEVALIPETLHRTTLGVRKVGDGVNIEVDPLARYACGDES